MLLRLHAFLVNLHKHHHGGGRDEYAWHVFFRDRHCRARNHSRIGWAETKDAVIEAWNHRAAPQAADAGRDWLSDAGIPADAGPPHHGEDRKMTFEVAHDGTGRRDPTENCALCRLKTRYWHKKSDVAVCPVCAETRLASEIPPKRG
jgi:hypothetical protein